jgi:hypothetical protein
MSSCSRTTEAECRPPKLVTGGRLTSAYLRTEGGHNAGRSQAIALGRFGS